jgi:hypothetical protein
MKAISKTTFSVSAISLGVSLLVAACGGGSSSGSSALSITGVTSTGKALNGATVEAHCANGTTGSATSSTDDKGTFTVSVSGGVLPCMLRSTGTDTSGNTVTMHSVADTGTSTTNVTPLTELVVSAATGTSGMKPSEAFASFANSTSTQGTLNTSKLTYAKQVVKSAVAAAATAGNKTVDLTNVDPLSGSFTVGSANDTLIDDLFTALKTNASTASVDSLLTSLSTAVATAAKASPTDAATASTAASTQASAVVTKPFAIANCAGARNVPYRMVTLGGNYGLSTAPTYGNSGSYSGAISWTWNDGSTETDTVTFNSSNACKFVATANGVTTTGAFAPSGIFITQNTSGTGIGFPEQTIPLSELAGTWNGLEFSPSTSSTGTSWSNSQSMVTIDSNGSVTSMKDCTGDTTANNSCVDSTDTKPTFSANTSGGFDVKAGTNSQRAFAYRAPSGSLMLVVTSGSGMLIATKQTTLATHPVDYQSVGYSVNASAATSTTSTTLSTSFSSFTMKVTKSDASSYTWLRSLLNGSTDNFNPTDLINVPRTGLRSRPAVTYTPTGTSTSVTSKAAVQMSVPTTGLVVGISTGGTAAPFMTLSVNDIK